MYWFGLILILGGFINIICAKKQMYWGFNAHLWLKLYGESSTRAIYAISGIILFLLGTFMIFSLWS